MLDAERDPKEPQPPILQLRKLADASGFGVLVGGNRGR
jgi:hypothetical protein